MSALDHLRRLQREQNNLQETYDLMFEQLHALRLSYAVEMHGGKKFQLKQEIENLEREYNEVDAKLSEIERRIELIEQALKGDPKDMGRYSRRDEVTVKAESSKVAEQGQSVEVLRVDDYDNVWIPALGDGQFKQTEHGHPSFQHPAYSSPNDRPYDAQMDRFAALVMYLSLKALAVRPELYREFGADDTHQLLLSANDFRQEYAFAQAGHPRVPDSHIQRLYTVGIDEIKPYLDELRRSLSTGHLPDRLDSIVTQRAHHNHPVFDWEDSIDASSSP